MSRSTYIYVVSYKDHVGGAAPLLARTVKYELVGALGHFPAAMLDDVEVWRMRDNGQAFDVKDRVHLGSGAEFLTKERPAAPAPKMPCPEGFHWIGQSFATCDKCTLPAWEHAGHATPGRSDNPHGPMVWELRPWEPGEADRIRLKWDPDYAAKVKANLAKLDGTTASAVGLVTGMDRAQLDDLGGFNPEVTP